jgi:hypothetical protein
MKILLKIAKDILDLNEYASLTGTLMLKLRNIDLGRDPKDIDILIRDYATNIKLPEYLEKDAKDLGMASDGSGIKLKYDGILIDIMSSSEEPEKINGYNLASVKGLIDAKYKYSLQNNEMAKKHHDDLIKLGFEFPKPIEDDDLCF